MSVPQGGRTACISVMLPGSLSDKTTAIPIPGLGTEALRPCRPRLQTPVTGFACEVGFRPVGHTLAGWDSHCTPVSFPVPGQALQRGRVTNPHSLVPEQALQEGIEAITH